MSLPVPRISCDTPWDSPERKAVIDPKREISEREALVRRAIYDPGVFTARGYDKGTPKKGRANENGLALYEETWKWAARAVLIALEQDAFGRATG